MITVKDYQDHGGSKEYHIIYLFSFRESVQDYKMHMHMEIVKFA
jgi:hypothetical protein